jgi:hypothetical protein
MKLLAVFCILFELAVPTTIAVGQVIYKERAMSREQQKETIKEFDLKKGVGSLHVSRDALTQERRARLAAAHGRSSVRVPKASAVDSKHVPAYLCLEDIALRAHDWARC